MKFSELALVISNDSDLYFKFRTYGVSVRHRHYIEDNYPLKWVGKYGSVLLLQFEGGLCRLHMNTDNQLVLERVHLVLGG